MLLTEHNQGSFLPQDTQTKHRGFYTATKDPLRVGLERCCVFETLISNLITAIPLLPSPSTLPRGNSTAIPMGIPAGGEALLPICLMELVLGVQGHTHS